MTRPRVAGLVAAAILAVLVAASPSSASVASAKTVTVNQWTASICRDFDRWTTNLTKSSTPSSLANPTAAKTAITKFLSHAVKATDTLIRDLKQAGAPKVQDGTTIAAAFANSAKDLRKNFARAKTKAAHLPTQDAAAFAAGAQTLLAELQSAGPTLETTLASAAKSYPAAALNDAFTTTNACGQG